VDLGPTTLGRDGGAKTRLFTLPSSSSPTIDIRLGGGVATVRQYLRAALIDEMHLALSPVLLGSGEHLLTGIDAPRLGYQCTEYVPTANVTHVILTRRG
jgi:dihydrofolate reductase